VKKTQKQNVFEIHLYSTKYYTKTCMYVLNINTLQLYFSHNKFKYLKSVKLEQLILFLMHFSYHEIVQLMRLHCI